jgi:hypothetical protein
VLGLKHHPALDVVWLSTPLVFAVSRALEAARCTSLSWQALSKVQTQFPRRGETVFCETQVDREKFDLGAGVTRSAYDRRLYDGGLVAGRRSIRSRSAAMRVTFPSLR